MMLHLQCWHHHRAALLSKVRRVEILMVLSNWEYECYMFIISSFKPKSFKHLFSTKGQLISKCLFEKIVWTKIPTKNLIDSAQQV